MIEELLYTSAPKGLKPGSRGFCTVVSTDGMAAPMAAVLEGLSGYRPLFPPGDPNVALNPVVLSHLEASIAGRVYSVLSRIADYGLDYSQRTNKLAHHIVLEPGDRPAGGPAWLMSQPGVLHGHWDGQVRIIPPGRQLPQGADELRVCTAWEAACGDAGWAGVLAESFLSNPERPAYLIFRPGLSLLPLLAEAIRLLPEERRWDVTFSTYFTKLPKSVHCRWRCVVAGSPEANESRRYVQALRLDLTASLGPAAGGELVTAARTGRPARPHASTLSPGPASSVAAAEDRLYRIQKQPPRPIPPPPGSASHRRTAARTNAGPWIAIGLLLLVAALGIAGVFLFRKPGQPTLVAGNVEPPKAAPTTREEPVSDPIVGDRPDDALAPPQATTPPEPETRTDVVEVPHLARSAGADQEHSESSAQDSISPPVEITQKRHSRYQYWSPPRGAQNKDASLVVLENLQGERDFQIWIPVDATYARFASSQTTISFTDPADGQVTPFLTFSIDEESSHFVVRPDRVVDFMQLHRVVIAFSGQSPDEDSFLFLYKTPTSVPPKNNKPRSFSINADLSVDKLDLITTESCVFEISGRPFHTSDFSVWTGNPRDCFSTGALWLEEFFWEELREFQDIFNREIFNEVGPTVDVRVALKASEIQADSVHSTMLSVSTLDTKGLTAALNEAFDSALRNSFNGLSQSAGGIEPLKARKILTESTGNAIGQNIDVLQNLLKALHKTPVKQQSDFDKSLPERIRTLERMRDVHNKVTGLVQEVSKGSLVELRIMQQAKCGNESKLVPLVVYHSDTESMASAKVDK